jgi:hypothetical protein
MNSKRRIKLIKKLSEFHPGIIQMEDERFAHYTGGMKDSGDLNWRYCLFEASVFDLEIIVKRLQKRTIRESNEREATKRMTPKEHMLRHKATVAMELLMNSRNKIKHEKIKRETQIGREKL